MFNLILFGPPGSGKGTQSAKLIEKYKLLHVSTGDLLRSEIAKKTKLGLEAKILMDAGSLVPDDIVIGMINEMINQNTDVDGFLFDGFPRTEVQAEALDRLLQEKNSCIEAMIAMEVSEDELVKRLMKRSETSGRSDDGDENIIRARLEEYKNKTESVARHYRKVNKAVTVNGMGTIEEVFNRICKEIEQLKVGTNC